MCCSGHSCALCLTWFIWEFISRCLAGRMPGACDIGLKIAPGGVSIDFEMEFLSYEGK